MLPPDLAPQRPTSSSLIAVLSAAFAGLVCEISFNAAREAAPTLAYAVLCALLTLLSAALIGLLTSRLRRPAVALGLWAGVCGAAIDGSTRRLRPTRDT